VRAEVRRRRVRLQSNVSEALANIPTTTHILGGAVIAADPEHAISYIPGAAPEPVAAATQHQRR